MKTNAQVPEALLLELQRLVQQLTGGAELDGPTFYLLVQEVAALDGELQNMTTSQIAECMDRAATRSINMRESYDAVRGRLEAMGSTEPGD